jgi:hypothetical protein
VLGEHVGPAVERALGRLLLDDGSNQVEVHTTFTVASGFTRWRPRVKALMPRSTSGMGKAAT